MPVHKWTLAEKHT